MPTINDDGTSFWVGAMNIGPLVDQPGPSMGEMVKLRESGSKYEFRFNLKALAHYNDADIFQFVNNLMDLAVGNGFFAAYIRDNLRPRITFTKTLPRRSHGHERNYPFG